jgi:hypothetical protein
MLPKFSVDYIAMPKHNHRVFTHQTDDPVEAEGFLMHLLASSARIKEIRHDGKALSGPQFNQMLKVAAERIALSWWSSISFLTASLWCDWRERFTRQ